MNAGSAMYSFLKMQLIRRDRRNLCRSAVALIAGIGLAACSPSDKAEQRAQDYLAKMTLEEKVGQVIQGDISTVTPEDAKAYNLGSVLNGGNSAPGGGKTASWQQWVDAADAYWRASTDTTDGGLGIPLLWGTDAVHGHNNLQMAVIFPHNSALGAAADPELMQAIGSVTAREVKATALDWVFAPTLAVAQDDRWGRAYESYSEDPKLVSDLGEAILRGLQGTPGSASFLDPQHVIATAKHFVGDGGTQYGIDKGDAVGTLNDIMETHAFPYEAAIENEVQTVMASFSSVNGVKMHGAKDLLTGTLRDEMGFNGFVIGDWNGHAEIPGCSPVDCPDALLAGVDMYMAPDSWKGLYENLLLQVKEGRVPMQRLDEAVLRILTVKIRAGLFEAGLPSQRPGVQRATLGAPAHREVARNAVRKSLVLLKNDNATLPFDPKKHIAIIGAGANSMSQQTGGWTLSWQGNDNANAEFETGQTILEGLSEKIEAAGGKVSFAETAAQLTGNPELIIYVFGEKPYAEFVGDMSDVMFEFADGPALAELNALKKRGVPIVSVFLTGRPLWINSHINQSDAFVIGWLPGTEAGGIADVLAAQPNGEIAHDFTGRLSFSWPSDGRGTPIDKNSKARVQFPFGYGLTYANAVTPMASLSEAAGVEKPGTQLDGVLMARGAARAPFSFFLGDSSNWRTPADAFLAESLAKSISSRGVDHKAQEDARQLNWRGSERAVASIQSQRHVDFTNLGDASNLNLTLHLRVDEPADAPLFLAMGCGDNCGGKIDIANRLAAMGNGWQDVTVPLTCFTPQGLNLAAVKAPVILETEGAWTISVTDIEITKGKNDCR